MITLRLFTCLAFLLTLASPLYAARKSVSEKRDEIREMHDEVLAELYKLNPDAGPRSVTPPATLCSPTSASTSCWRVSRVARVW